MAELNFVGVIGRNAAQLRRAQGLVGAVVLTAVAAFSHGCGHYGVDLDGSTDASVEPKGDGGKPSVTDESKPYEVTTNYDSAPTTSHSADDKSEKPKPPKDGGGIGETMGDAAVTGDASKSETTGADTGEVPSKDASVDDTWLPDGGQTLEAGTPPNTGEVHDTSEPRDPTLPPFDAGASSDAGPPTCDPNCSCVEQGQCELICLAEECVADCEANAVCDVVVGVSPTVKIDCAEGAVCSAVDVVAEVFDVTCLGEGDCHTHCGGEQSCAVECKGPGRCITKCHDAATCNVTCKDGADCYVLYDNLDNVELTCETGELTQCASSVTCGSACP